MLVTTTIRICERRITTTLGPVFGLAVRTRGVAVITELRNPSR